jgi:hypothetical protein
MDFADSTAACCLLQTALLPVAYCRQHCCLLPVGCLQFITYQNPLHAKAKGLSLAKFITANILLNRESGLLEEN